MKGKQITTHEELTSLIQNKKSVLIDLGSNPYRIPASTMLFRPYGDVTRLMSKGYMYEYICEPKRKPFWGIPRPIIMDMEISPSDVATVDIEKAVAIAIFGSDIITDVDFEETN